MNTPHGFMATHLPTLQRLGQRQFHVNPATARKVRRKLAACCGEAIIHAVVIAIGFGLGSLSMWFDIYVQCGTHYKQFVIWGDEEGYECFYESPFHADHAERWAIERTYGL